MKSSENILLVMLVLTAAILGVMVIGSLDNQKAYADSADRSLNSDYIMVSGDVSEGTGLVYVIDIPNKKLLVYGLDSVRGNMQVLDDKVNLKTIFRTKSR